MVRFKIFNLIQGQMKGQDNMFIQVVKVSSVILMLYLMMFNILEVKVIIIEILLKLLKVNLY